MYSKALRAVRVPLVSRVYRGTFRVVLCAIMAAKPSSLHALPPPRSTVIRMVPAGSAGSTGAVVVPQVDHHDSAGDQVSSNDTLASAGAAMSQALSSSASPTTKKGQAAGSGGDGVLDRVEAMLKGFASQIDHKLNAKFQELSRASHASAVDKALLSLPPAGGSSGSNFSGSNRGVSFSNSNVTPPDLVGQLSQAVGGSGGIQIHAGPASSRTNGGVQTNNAARGHMSPHEATCDHMSPHVTGQGQSSGTSQEFEEFQAWRARNRAVGDNKKKDLFSLEQLLKCRALSGSFDKWVKAYTFKTNRNYHECATIAAAVDALLDDGVVATARGIDILLRRLVGVQLADKHDGRWTVADQISGLPGDALLDRAMESEILKSASNYERYQHTGGVATAPKKAAAGANASDWREKKGKQNPKENKKPPSSAGGNK